MTNSLGDPPNLAQAQVASGAAAAGHDYYDDAQDTANEGQAGRPTVYTGRAAAGGRGVGPGGQQGRATSVARSGRSAGRAMAGARAGAGRGAGRAASDGRLSR